MPITDVTFWLQISHYYRLINITTIKSLKANVLSAICSDYANAQNHKV